MFAFTMSCKLHIHVHARTLVCVCGHKPCILALCPVSIVRILCKFSCNIVLNNIHRFSGKMVLLGFPLKATYSII